MTDARVRRARLGYDIIGQAASPSDRLGTSDDRADTSPNCVQTPWNHGRTSTERASTRFDRDAKAT